MQVTPRQFSIAAGILLAVIGFLGLVIPVNAGSVNCGNAITGSSNAGELKDSALKVRAAVSGTSPSSTNYEQMCSDALSSRRTWGIPLLAIGAIAAIGGAVVRRDPSTTDEARQTLPA